MAQQLYHGFGQTAPSNPTDLAQHDCHEYCHLAVGEIELAEPLYEFDNGAEERRIATFWDHHSHGDEISVDTAPQFPRRVVRRAQDVRPHRPPRKEEQLEDRVL